MTADQMRAQLATLKPEQLSQLVPAVSSATMGASNIDDMKTALAQLSPEQTLQAHIGAMQAQGQSSPMQQGLQALGTANIAMPPIMQNAANAVGAPSAGQNMFNFAQGAVHPITPANSTAGTLGQMAATVPLADVGALARAGSAIPGVGKALGSIGAYLDPMLAKSGWGMAAKGILNSGLSGAAGSAAMGQSPFSGGAIGAAVGTALHGPLGILNAGKLAASNYLNKSQSVQDMIDNMTGGVPVGQIQGNALQKINSAREAAQNISNNNYKQVFDSADAMGIDATNPQILQSTAQSMLPDVAKLAGPEYKQLQNDVTSATQPFDLSNRLYFALRGLGTDAAAARRTASQVSSTTLPIQSAYISSLSPEESSVVKAIMSNPFGLQDINNMKSMYQGQAQKATLAGDMKQAYFYNQLGDAAKNDTLQLTANTPLQPMLQNAHAFYQQHVLPLQQFKNMSQSGDIDAMKNAISNPENANVFGALTPSPLSQMNGLDATTLTQAKNATKASVLAKTSSDINQVNPEATLKQYVSTSASSPHMFSPQKPGLQPLFDQNDVVNSRQLISKIGIGSKGMNQGDASYAAAVAAGHHPAAYAIKKGVDIAQSLLPNNMTKYLNNPDVVKAMIARGTPGGQQVLKSQLTGGMLGSIPGFAGMLGSSALPQQ